MDLNKLTDEKFIVGISIVKSLEADSIKIAEIIPILYECESFLKSITEEEMQLVRVIMGKFLDRKIKRIVANDIENVKECACDE